MIILERIKNLLERIFYSPEQYGRKMGVTIGQGCWIATYDFGSEPYLISIGNHVQVTTGVSFITHGGGWIYRKEIPDIDFFGNIVIKDNVYIGTGSCILPGVTIESNVIVAAKSVVTKSIPQGVIVGGNPCRIIGNIEDYKQKILKFNLRTKNLAADQKREKLLNTDKNLFIQKPYLAQ